MTKAVSGKYPDVTEQGVTHAIWGSTGSDGCLIFICLRRWRNELDADTYSNPDTHACSQHIIRKFACGYQLLQHGSRATI